MLFIAVQAELKYLENTLNKEEPRGPVQAVGYLHR